MLLSMAACWGSMLMVGLSCVGVFLFLKSLLWLQMLLLGM